MSRLTIVHYSWGCTTKCSLDCVCQNGVWLVPCTDPICEFKVGYIKGDQSPNYPMPAINGPTYIGKYGIYQSYADLEIYDPQYTWTNL